MAGFKTKPMDQRSRYYSGHRSNNVPNPKKLAHEGTVNPSKEPETKKKKKKKDFKIINPSVLGRRDGEKTALHQQEREHRRRQAFLVLAHHFNYYKKNHNLKMCKAFIPTFVSF